MLPASARPNARGQIENAAFPPEAREWAFETFREALRPLEDSGKLGYVLFQMAPWIKHGREALDYLASLPGRLPGVTLAVEFRDASWLPGHTDEVLRFLAERGLTYVSVDAPRTAAGVATSVALTSAVAVLRLHGRNAAGFLKQLRGESPSVAEKYGYLYDQAELTEIVDRGKRLAGHAASRVLQAQQQRGGRARDQRYPDPGVARARYARPERRGGGVASPPGPLTSLARGQRFQLAGRWAGIRWLRRLQLAGRWTGFRVLRRLRLAGRWRDSACCVDSNLPGDG